MEKDLDNVLDFIEETNHRFIDDMMIQVFEMRDNYIIQELGKVCMRIGVYVDEERLKKWLKMCASLENIPDELAKDIAITNSLQRLRNRVRYLEEENHNLTQELIRLKGEEDYEF